MARAGAHRALVQRTGGGTMASEEQSGVAVAQTTSVGTAGAGAHCSLVRCPGEGRRRMSSGSAAHDGQIDGHEQRIDGARVEAMQRPADQEPQRGAPVGMGKFPQLPGGWGYTAGYWQCLGTGHTLLVVCY